MEPDFARIHAAKEKAHLESSHRSLHNFEIRIIKAFEDRIIKTEPGYLFPYGKKDKITVTFLNITLADLKNSGLIEAYRHQHNSTKHYFSENGKASSWIPDQKLGDYFKEEVDTLSFSSQEVKEFVKYGFKKTTATVSKKRTIRHDNQDYYVTVGADLFSHHKSTPVHISQYHDKLFIFEQAPNGILLGEALAQKPYEKPTKPSEGEPEPNELEQIISFLEQHSMVVTRPTLIEYHHKGLGLVMAKNVFQLHGADHKGKTVWKRKLSRDKWLKILFETTEPGTVIGMEACAGAHHWSRVLIEKGYEVRIIPPQFVKPFVMRVFS